MVAAVAMGVLCLIEDILTGVEDNQVSSQGIVQFTVNIKVVPLQHAFLLPLNVPEEDIAGHNYPQGE